MQTECNDVTRTMRSEAVAICDLCGSVGTVVFSGLHDHFGNVAGTFSMRRCSNPECAILWLDPRPLEEDIHLAYQSYYTHDSRLAAAPKSSLSRLKRSIFRVAHVVWQRLFNSEKQRTIVKSMYLLDQEPGRVLDVGCGNGTRLAQMRERGWEVYGQEVDEAAASAAKRRFIDIFVGDMKYAPLPNNSFDFIILNHVLEHLHSPHAILTKCCELLKPGGILVAVTPNAGSYGLRRFGRNWRGLEIPRHIRVYTPRAAATLAKDAGFGAVRSWTTAVHAESIALGSYAIASQQRGTPYAGVFTALNVMSATMFQLIAQLKHKRDATTGEECVLWATK